MHIHRDRALYAAKAVEAKNIQGIFVDVTSPEGTWVAPMMLARGRLRQCMILMKLEFFSWRQTEPRFTIKSSQGVIGAREPELWRRAAIRHLAQVIRVYTI